MSWSRFSVFRSRLPLYRALRRFLILFSERGFLALLLRPFWINGSSLTLVCLHRNKAGQNLFVTVFRSRLLTVEDRDDNTLSNVVLSSPLGTAFSLPPSSPRTPVSASFSTPPTAILKREALSKVPSPQRPTKAFGPYCTLYAGFAYSTT